MSVTAPTPNVPADWGVVRTSEVCEVQNGCAFKSEFFNEKSEGLPLIRIRDVHSGRSDTFYSGPFDQKYVVSDGDLLIGMDGEFRVRKWRSGKGLLNQRVCRLIPYGEPMIADFLYYSIGRPLKQIEDFTPFTTVKHISAGQIRAIELPLPPLPEQKKIAHILSTVQRAIEAQERIIQTTTELKKALMHKLFTEGLRGEPQKQTEIGPIPESWSTITLGELCGKPNGALQTGPFGSQLHKHEYQEDGIAVVNPTHLAGNRINHENVPRVSEKVAQRLGKHRLRKFDILFARRGEIGRQGLVTEAEETWLCGTGCFLVRASNPLVDNRFLALYFATDRLVKWLYSHAAGAIMPNLNNSVMQRLPVFYPDLQTQTAIIETFTTIDQKLSAAERRQTALQCLFRTLLQELMTAKTRVHELDLPIGAHSA